MSAYRYEYQNERYVVYEDNHEMITPAGNVVRTMYESIAKKITSDAAEHGYDFSAAGNLLPWQFTMLDNFSKMSHEQIESILTQCFLVEPDWTIIDRNEDDESKRLFGVRWSTRKEQIIRWLEECTYMQMTAACCIGNAYHSINLAFALAMIMEEKSGEECKQAFEELAELVEEMALYGPPSETMKDFENFYLYYGIPLGEEGPVIESILADYDDDEEDFDLDDLEGESISIETLVGRNFYHYTNGTKDEEQPLPYSFPDFELDIWDDEEENEDYDEEPDEEVMSDYILDDCWVKRYVDDEEPTVFYLVYIVENGEVIEEVGCITETIRQIAGGMLMFPGMEPLNSKEWEDTYYIPDKIITDLKMLRKKRILPQDFSFEGKKLPSSRRTDSITIQSAERLAYMNLSFYITPDDTMEGSFSYSTYQSSGNSYNDMFTRPVGYSDREDEAKDLLLHLLDEYTDEEYNDLFK